MPFITTICPTHLVIGFIPCHQQRTVSLCGYSGYGYVGCSVPRSTAGPLGILPTGSCRVSKGSNREYLSALSANTHTQWNLSWKLHLFLSQLVSLENTDADFWNIYFSSLGFLCRVCLKMKRTASLKSLSNCHLFFMRWVLCFSNVSWRVCWANWPEDWRYVQCEAYPPPCTSLGENIGPCPSTCDTCFGGLESQRDCCKIGDCPGNRFETSRDVFCDWAPFIAYSTQFRNELKCHIVDQ